MAIIYSYPLNDDIKPLDELVGTTEKSINGKLKTVTRNFLLQDLAEFFIVDGGLQKTITLTTTDTDGAATLNQLTGVLNIPRYDQNGFIKLTSLSSIATGLTYNNTTGVFSLSVGYSIPTIASQTNWDAAYNYRLASLTTTGTSGPATLAGNVLNIPDYSEGIVDSPITIVNGASLFSTGLIGTGDGATNATNSIFLGDSAGENATDANYSNFLGFRAGYMATGVEGEEFRSNFIGYEAGREANNAKQSNFLGNNAGSEATDASYSNFIGRYAGSEATSANSSNFIGSGAGRYATNANYSNFLGYQAGLSFTDNNIGSNNIIIGTNISLPDATANSLNIGGILFGTGTYSDIVSDDPSITPTSEGKIGIGVVEPTNTLHIYSEAANTSGLRLERLTSSSPTSTGQAIGVDASGNIVTVEGSVTSDLQEVTDEGAITTNSITANSITTTIDSTINGVRVGRGNISDPISENTAFGYQALKSVVHTTGNTGYYNTAFGDSALTALISGEYNSAFGDWALIECTTGKYNIAIGTSALRKNNGEYNTGVGVYALGFNKGSYNTAIGFMAGGFNTTPSTGSWNILVGMQAGRDITSGSNNLLIENITTASITSGSYNIVLNPKQKSGVTTGSYNTIIGCWDGAFPSAMLNNVIIGDGQGNIRFRTTDTGLTTVPGQTNALIEADTTGKAVVTKEYLSTSNYWTKTGNDISNNNTGNVKVGNGVYASLFYANSSLGGFAFRADIASNTPGLSIYSSGSSKPIYIVHSSTGDIFKAEDGIGITKSKMTSSGLWKYGVDLSSTYDDRTLVDKGYVNNTFVPYTGATTDVDLGLNDITANSFVKSGGTSSQILAADGSVITAGNNITITGGQISSVGGAGGGGSSVNYYLNGGTSQGTFGGTTYYEFSKTAVIGTGADFSRSSNGLIASFITDVADPSLLLIPAGNWNLEFFFNSSSAGGSPSFYVELYKYDGTTFTLIASNSATPEGITNGTSIYAYFTALAVPETVLTVNDRLAIRVFVNASSKTITLHTQNGHLCEVITTFTAGLTALNGLQAQVQNFATGTTGTDFDIISSGSTHTFNLPSASATARGVVTTGPQTFAGAKTFTGVIGIITNSADYGIQVNSDDIGIEVNALGIGIDVESAFQQAGIFNVLSTNTSNIAEFKKDNVLKAVVQNDGKITATAGTAGTDVVVKSQLDLKANDASVVHLTGNETIAGVKTFTGAIGASNLSGTNTGDQNLSGYALLASPTFTGTVVLPSTTSIGNVSSTEIGYLDNVTDSIQTQLNSKISKDDGATYDTNFIKTVTSAEYAAIGTKDATTLYFII